VLTPENRRLGKGAYGLFGNEDRARVVIRLPSGKVLAMTGNAGSICTWEVNGEAAAVAGAYRSRVERPLWEGEYAVPMALLEASEAFEIDFVNLQATPEEKVETLAFRRNLEAPDRLCAVRLRSAGVTARVRTELLGHTHPNAVWLDCWNPGAEPAEVTVSTRLAACAAADSAEPVAGAVRALASVPEQSRKLSVPACAKRWAWLPGPTDFGAHVLQYRVEAEGRVRARGLLFITVDVPLEVKLRYYFLQHRMWQRLGRDKVEFLPYWRPPALAEVKADIEGTELPEGRIKVSAYLRRDRKQALLVVANLDQVGYSLKVKPDLETLGLGPGEFACADPVLKGYWYPKEGGRIRLDVYPQRWRAVLLTGR